jgi:hypothetical protein
MVDDSGDVEQVDFLTTRRKCKRNRCLEDSVSVYDKIKHTSSYKPKRQMERGVEGGKEINKRKLFSRSLPKYTTSHISETE